MKKYADDKTIIVEAAIKKTKLLGFTFTLNDMAYETIAGIKLGRIDLKNTVKIS